MSSARECSACAVMEGRCPDCGTVWVVGEDGKRVGISDRDYGRLVKIESAAREVLAADDLMTPKDATEFAAAVRRGREAWKQLKRALDA